MNSSHRRQSPGPAWRTAPPYIRAAAACASVALAIMPAYSAKLASVRETNISSASEGEAILTLREEMAPRREPPPAAAIPGALARAQELLERNPDDRDAYLRVGSLFLMNGQVEEAATVYWWAARRWPSDPAVLDNLGAALLAAGDGGSAAVLYDHLVAEYPDNPDYRFNFASALYGIGAYDAAREQWGKLEETGGTASRRAKVLYNLAMTELALGRTNAALEYLDKCYRVQPENPFALWAQARIFARQGAVSNMVDRLEKVKRLMTESDFELIVRHPAFAPWWDEPFFRKLRGEEPAASGSSSSAVKVTPHSEGSIPRGE